jgi:hypothetical protein
MNVQKIEDVYESGSFPSSPPAFRMSLRGEAALSTLIIIILLFYNFCMKHKNCKKVK